MFQCKLILNDVTFHMNLCVPLSQTLTIFYNNTNTMRMSMWMKMLMDIVPSSMFPCLHVIIFMKSNKLDYAY
jgi:hypothetical protein